uniref:Uncharacterized protein n=1 Tax=Arion vulgaris TaxID=1028688 RepID=A0A0B7AI69_9EUPU
MMSDRRAEIARKKAQIEQLRKERKEKEIAKQTEGPSNHFHKQALTVCPPTQILFSEILKSQLQMLQEIRHLGSSPQALRLQVLWESL